MKYQGLSQNVDATLKFFFLSLWMFSIVVQPDPITELCDFKFLCQNF